MADQTPGQVINPNDGVGSSTEALQPEVAVQLSHAATPPSTSQNQVTEPTPAQPATNVPVAPSSPPPAEPQAQSPTPAPEPPLQQSVQAEPQAANQPVPEVASPAEESFFRQDIGYAGKPQLDVTGEQTDNTLAESSISWTASEYIAHQKSGKWYGLLALGTVLLAALAYFITGGDIVSVVVIVVVAIVFGGYAGRKPKELQYTVGPDGLSIGGKAYSFHDLRSFSVLNEGAFSSISFMPLKRFMPTLSIYYAPDDEDKIVDVLSQYLPFEPREHDTVDRLMRKIRF